MAGDSTYPNQNLLLLGEGSDGSTTIIDSSINPKTVTAVGGAAISTAEKPYGTSSLKINSGYFEIPNSTEFDFGSGDFRVDGYFFMSGNSPADPEGARGGVICTTWGATIAGWAIIIGGNTTTTGIGFAFDTWGPSGSNNCTQYRVTGMSISQSAWHHFEAGVASGTRYVSLDGVVLTGSINTVGGGYTQANSMGNKLRVGKTPVTAYPLTLNGYVKGLRIIKGAAPHTSNFTPPGMPLPYAGQVAGIIRDSSGAVCARTVRVSNRGTGGLIGITTSDAGTGSYTVNCPTLDEVQRTVLSNTTTAPLENDIIDRIIPA